MGVGNRGVGGASRDPGQSSADMRDMMAHGFSSVSYLDVIIAHAPLWFVLITGLVAGLMIWLVPSAIFVANAYLARKYGGVTIEMARYASYTRNLTLLIGATGAIGIMLAGLRRVSARKKWYVNMGRMVIGFNSLVATVLGFLIAVGILLTGTGSAALFWFMGLGAPSAGFLLDAIWQMFHDRLLGWFGRPDKDVLLTLEAESFLLRHPGLYGFQYHGVEIASGHAVILGEFDNKDARDRVRNAVLCIQGVNRVTLETLSEREQRVREEQAKRA